MTDINPQGKTTALDAMTLAFKGASLIEASAGTGKTYTISGLYLRLLLGHGELAPLNCEQILVVTFTNAATQELRDRIRKRIQTAFKCFLGLSVNDDFVQALYEQCEQSERNIALRRLDLALKSLDEAAIFTIHGFCQRVLSDMAFESSLLFESEFTLDDSEFLHHSVRDFWRDTCYHLPSYLAQEISANFSEPDALVAKLRPLLGASEAQPSMRVQDFSRIANALETSLTRFKLLWQQENEATLALLHSLPLNGQRFGKQTDGYPKLATLFDALSNWVKFGQGLPPTKVLAHLALSDLKLNKGGVVPSASEAPLLEHIDNLLALLDQLIPSFLIKARDDIKARFRAQKHQRNLLTPDDLLLTLAQALTDNPATLAKAIAKRFPIALIDEFQDTDPLQFTIFNQVYGPKQDDNDLSLLMIGDPKQAIYAFRGADIYTYIEARNQTQAHYNLDTNYRSSSQLVKGVNRLFSQHSDPFISQAIPFDAVKTPPNADKKRLVEAGDPVCALRIKLLAEDAQYGLNKTKARERLSADAASEIKRLLTQSQQGLCHIHGNPLIAKNIAVLVRDRNEAAVIKAALNERGIGAVFLSRDSVFNTLEAREMVLILRAIAKPKDERAIRAALATELMGYHSLHIHGFNYDEIQRQTVLDNFSHWHQVWLRKGVMPALLELANVTGLIPRFLAQASIDKTNDEPSFSAGSADDNPNNSSADDVDESNMLSEQGSGERRLTDFRHLSELLQQKATELDGSSALINWFEQQLISVQAIDEQQLRLESEQNLVQIVTIHKSKGLEYPVCFIPFVSLARGGNKRPSPILYHKNGQLVWDVEGTDEGYEAYKQENLAEDLRLLYVALTRPVYLCYLYVANQCRVLKSGISSQLHETGIGYLLGAKDKQVDCNFIQAKLDAIVDSDAISLERVEEQIDASPLAKGQDSDLVLKAKTLSHRPSHSWRVGSYSGLVKHKAHEKVSPGADDEDFSDELLRAQSEAHSHEHSKLPHSLELEKGHEPLTSINEANPAQTENQDLLDRFSFERGANAGSFMHTVLELFDFTKADSELVPAIEQAMVQYGFDQQVWLAPLTLWYQEILNTPLQLTTKMPAQGKAPQACFSLNQLSPAQTLVEMEFYLPINALDCTKLNQLLTEFGYPAGLSFDTLKGMLKGFIDLTFQYQGQYFIADYKSNHLGDTLAHYQDTQMRAAIDAHQYHLQYIIYTLALHRYLSLRLAHYDYERDIGGCYYLFLRGMSPNSPIDNTGVYFHKPPFALIKKLDKLINTEEDSADPVSGSGSVSLQQAAQTAQALKGGTQ